MTRFLDDVDLLLEPPLASVRDVYERVAGSAWLRAAVRRGFSGEFLAGHRIPWHDCDRSHRSRFAGGLTSEILLRKFCTVGPPILPALPPTV